MTAFALDRPGVVAASESYIGHPAPLFSRLPIPYRVVPLPIRTALLSIASRRRTRAGLFPDWPIERGLDSEVTPPTYEGRRAAFVLTHDVDSKDELDIIDKALSIDRRAGVSSSVGFVPRQSWPGEALVRKLQAEGREVYWHDIEHNGRLPYMPIDQIRRSFDAVVGASPWAAELRTFRAGQLLTSADLTNVVAERFDIDMSIPDTERGGPYGQAAGCGSVYPFRLRGLLELPLTMPQDVFLRHVYRLPPAQIAEIWNTKLDYIVERGGIAVLNIHPIWIVNDSDLARVVEALLVRVAQNPEILATTPSGIRAALSDSVLRPA